MLSPDTWQEGYTPAVVLGGVAGWVFLLYLLGDERVSEWLEKRDKKLKKNPNKPSNGDTEKHLTKGN
ncbi:hypothetical protein EPO56_00825 [Patescibacteria group bacterium]|nr:MAG: hypothetical protein EPO56_00825 [Patescibacteria group bacterium]